MALRRKLLVALIGTFIVSLSALVLFGWYVCDMEIHPGRVAEKWPEVGKWPRYTLSQFGLARPENVYFKTSDGITLSGWFIQGDSGATIILVHGKGGDRAEMLPHAAYLYRHSFSVLLYDARHRGKSGGHHVTLGAREPLDVQAAVRYLGSRNDVDQQRIGVQGNSQGAVAGIIAAARTPEIRGVVAESAFMDLRTAISDGFQVATGLPSFPFARIAKFICEYRLEFDLDKVAPIDIIARVSPRAVFLIHDADDSQLKAESAQRLYETAGEPRQLWIVPGAPHGKGVQTAPEEYERRVIAFWKDIFRGEFLSPSERSGPQVGANSLTPLVPERGSQTPTGVTTRQILSLGKENLNR